MKSFALTYLIYLRLFSIGKNIREDPNNPGCLQWFGRCPVKIKLQAQGSPFHTQEIWDQYEKDFPDLDPLWMEVTDCDSRTQWFLDNMVKYGLIEKVNIGYRVTDFGKKVQKTQGLKID